MRTAQKPYEVRVYHHTCVPISYHALRSGYQCRPRSCCIHVWRGIPVQICAVVQQKKPKAAQEAHEAIRPGREAVFRAPQDTPLSGRERKLYDLIWKRTMATQMANARLEFTNASITASLPARAAPGTVHPVPVAVFFRATSASVSCSLDSSAPPMWKAVTTLQPTWRIRKNHSPSWKSTRMLNPELHSRPSLHETKPSIALHPKPVWSRQTRKKRRRRPTPVRMPRIIDLPS